MVSDFQTIGQLFKNPPTTWGLRGDPYLWQKMQENFLRVAKPGNRAQFNAYLQDAFLLFTGRSIDSASDAKDMFFVKEFAHGGMSSGGISAHFWREYALPLLLARFEKQDDNCIKTTLLHAAYLIKAHGIEVEYNKLEAQLLLQHVLGKNRDYLIREENTALQPNNHAAFKELLERRLNGEPVAYILGYREFYGLILKVTPDTLIPRPDTETLVEAALARIPLMVRQAHHERNLSAPVRPELVEGQQNDSSSSPSFSRKWESMLNLNQKMYSRLRENDEVENKKFEEKPYVALKSLDSDFRRNDNLSILDLGTGAGAIALAIAKHRPQANITALDASQAALDIAIENAQHLTIANVKFLLSDWFSALNLQDNAQKFDVIVSNPPYIEADDAHLKQGDLRFEPISALASGADGLDDIRIIISQAKKHLNPHGFLLLEHGYNQAEAVADLLKKAGFSEVETVKDFGGNDRVTLGKIA